MTNEIVDWENLSCTTVLESAFGEDGNFYFITAAHLQQTYLLLLGMATSRRDVSRLHELLPEEFRIFRDDLIALEKLWKKLNQGKTSLKSRFHDSIAQKMLLMSTSTKWDEPLSFGARTGNLRSYYLEHMERDISNKYVPIHGRHFPKNSRRLNREVLLKIGCCKFKTEMIVTEEEGKRIYFWLHLMGPITITFVEMLKKCKQICMYTLEYDEQTKILVILPLLEFKESLSPKRTLAPSRSHSFEIVDEESFLQNLEEQIRKIGLDLQKTEFTD